MKVTVCQFNPAEDTLDQALDRLSEHLVKHGSDFLLLPEMCFAPWLAADPVPDPQAWQDAVAMHEARIAGLRDLGVGAVVGTRPVIRENGSRRNQAYVWEAANGSAAAWHEKYYLPDEPGYFEHSWYDRGTQDFTVARGAGIKLGVQICTEMWFFEWARHYARSRVDLLLVPRASPHASVEKWLAGGQTAAVCSGAYCLSSNLWAPAGGKADLGGLGWITDPEGNILATTSPDDPFATVEIDLAFARDSKRTYPRYVPE